MHFDFSFLDAGERGLVVEFGTEIDEKINARVHYLAGLLKSPVYQDVILELIPTYRSLLIIFEPLRLTRAELKTKIEKEMQLHESSFTLAKLPENARVVEIPVCYEGEFAPDLTTVAAHNNLTAEEVIKIHTSRSYKVYMLGFLPGFPYLGGLDERIFCPRLKTPRTLVPAGSVGIAGSQTGVYPLASPGGWQLIGKTPLKVFDLTKEQPFLVQPGDSLVFKAIGLAEYTKLAHEVRGHD